MLLVDAGSSISMRFVFYNQGSSFDPLEQSTPKDIYFTVVRGDYGDGQIIDGPYSYLNQDTTPSGPALIERVGSGEYRFTYSVSEDYLDGVYTVVCQTSDPIQEIRLLSKFQVKNKPVSLKPINISSASSAISNFKSLYQSMGRGTTSTILLIGHSDNIPLNNPVFARTAQDAINALGADIDSPLLRGFLDAYGAGARDIVVMAAAPMSEYVTRYEDRNQKLLFLDDSSTPSGKTFYERYYERLQISYDAIKELDFIDIVVPLEVSFLKSGDVDFATQLAQYCYDFHNSTGFVQLGVIGTRSGGIRSEDVDLIYQSDLFNNKLTSYNSLGSISSDIGRFIVPVYGEVTMKHSTIASSYTSSLSPVVAGMISSSPLNISMIRKRIPGALSINSASLNQSQYEKLDSVGINFAYRGPKSKRNAPYEVYLSNEYTLARSDSVYSKLAQMRLVTNCVNEVKVFAEDAVGKFSYDKVVEKVVNLLNFYKENNIVIDYAFDVQVIGNMEKSLIFNINLISSLGLKSVNFSVAAGPRA
jgi:hypothetical protein